MCSESEELSAKERILDAAAELFFQGGFKGTSVRAIAEKADVNPAAINYYFRSKNELYKELLREGYKDVDLEIKNIYEESPEIEFVDFIEKVYMLFQKDSEKTSIGLKLIMEPQLTGDIERLCPEQPPGYEYFKKVLRSEVEVDDYSELWAIRVIIVHIYAVVGVMYFELNTRSDSEVDAIIERRRVGIKRLAKAIVENLKTGSADI